VSTIVEISKNLSGNFRHYIVIPLSGNDKIKNSERMQL